MQRCGSGLLLFILAITFLVALSGCLGKSTSNSSTLGVTSVSLNPTSFVSINVGTTVVFTAAGKNASGGAVAGVNIQYIVGVPQGITTAAPLSIASNGNACAGTWDVSVSICSPGVPGVAVVTAVINGVSSAPTTVYVHQPINSIQIVNAGGQAPLYDCFSQGQSWQYGGVAYSGNPPVDISNTVGPMIWSSSNAGVVTTTATLSGSPGNQINLVQATAKAPGITQLFATAGGTTSSPLPFTTCLVQSIMLQINGQGQQGNSTLVTNGGSVPVTATVFDTLHLIANSPPLANPPLTWSTTNPEVAAFTTTTNTTSTNIATARANLGGATLFASCVPPTCNIGLPGYTPPIPATLSTPAMPSVFVPSLPIYSSDGVLSNGTNAYGVISVNVTSASAPPTYTAYVATTDCDNQDGCTSALFSVTQGTTPIGTSIMSLPRTPNSMMFNHLATARLYIGSNQGLMFVDVSTSTASVGVASNESTPCNVALCGELLTVSNDGKLAVVSDKISTPNQVYIYNAGSSSATGGGSSPTLPVDIIIPGETATAAAFSPDQLKLFILTNSGNLYVYSTVDALSSAPIATSVNDVKFSADGSFAYVAGASFTYPAPGPTVPSNSVSAFATCNAQPTVANPALSPDSDFVTTPGIQLQIFPSPDARHVVALDPPDIDIFSIVDSQTPLPYNQFICNGPTPAVDIAPMVNFPPTVQSYNLGQGSFTPLYTQLVNDGNELIVVAQNVPAVLKFNVGDGTTTAIPLSGSPSTGCLQCVGTSTPLSASASTDGSQVFVAACDVYPNNDTTKACASGSVHIVNTVSQGDFQQVPYVNINDANNPNMCNSQGGSAPLCVPNLIAIRPK